MYIDSLPEAWRNMQVKHLLNHSSGIGFYGNEALNNNEQALKLLKESSLLYPIGSKQQYANYDYALPGCFLEKIYQKPFVKILQDELATPAGMYDGGFD